MQEKSSRQSETESFLPNIDRAMLIWFGEMRSKPHAPPLNKQVLIENAT